MPPANPVIIHEMKSSAGGPAWLHFENPHKIITANTLGDVLPALRELELLVNQNHWYAAGYISYEASPAFDPALKVRPAAPGPLLWFGLYSAPRLTPHLPVEDAPYELEPWIPTVTRETYNASIAAIKDEIARGQTYQVNYTFRLRSRLRGSALALFGDMVRAQADGYSAFMDAGGRLVCSASPELFFRMEGNTITCRPMKGTVRRGRWLAEDLDNAAWLKSSVKNRAENVMIVDMIRNDLGRLAKTGSVRVPELFITERYRTLWQMTTSVSAEIEASFVDILTALFPCASITGAPKVSTMKIIAALETTPRGLYTGAIGYLAPGRMAQFSVGIRTLVIQKSSGEAEYGVGGGIVWDSTSRDEYAEALLKAQVLTDRRPEFSLLETMRFEPGTGCSLLNRHLDRMSGSAEYFGYPFDRLKIITVLQNAAARMPREPRRVRLLLNHVGEIRVEDHPLPAADPSPVRLRLARNPVDSNNLYLYHKTTLRAVYDTARQEQADCDDVLLFNERGELTESTIANLVVLLHGQLYTPPLACGLLPGTLRAELLAGGRIQERILTPADLPDCEKIYLVNSLRGWREAEVQSSNTGRQQ